MIYSFKKQQNILTEAPHIEIPPENNGKCVFCPICQKSVCQDDFQIEKWIPLKYQRYCMRKYNSLLYEYNIALLVCDNHHIFFFNIKDKKTHKISEFDIKLLKLKEFLMLLQANFKNVKSFDQKEYDSFQDFFNNSETPSEKL